MLLHQHYIGWVWNAEPIYYYSGWGLMSIEGENYEK